MSKIEVNTVAPQCGTTLTLGESGDTVQLGSGASQSGFGRTGAVDWQTTAKTTSFAAVNGEGYFINSAGGQVTVTLPGSPSAGDIVAISDYNNTAQTNTHIINRNGNKINGNTSNLEISKNATAVELVYVDATNGWQSVVTSNTNDIQNAFIIASGGTVSEDGDFKVHTFTGPGTFTVSNTGPGSSTVDYLVIAGGGGGGGDGPNGNTSDGGGGGGAGGYRESSGAASGCYTRSPLGACVAALPVSAPGSYPVTVGAGGTGTTPSAIGTAGSNSVFTGTTTITSAGGGLGGSRNETIPGRPDNAGGNGGSGGGAGGDGTDALGGNGNTPPVSPAQGSNGGAAGSSGYSGSPAYGSGGGGGATAVGTNATPTQGGPGGAGGTSSINGAPTARAGGGGGGAQGPAPQVGSGTGGGGSGGSNCAGVDATAGTANTGGGGGGGDGPGPNGDGKSGGSGVVIIRYKYQ